MSKPTMKAEIVAGKFSLEWGWIDFDATPDAASAMSEFGKLSRVGDTDSYSLDVDLRFDLMEVYQYIMNYGKGTP